MFGKISGYHDAATIILYNSRTLRYIMTDESSAFEAMHLTKSRLESLSDAIFAFSMTLLVISINLPDKSQIVQSQEYATHLLLSLYSDFFHYFLAFVILGAFWLTHHIIFHPVKALDRVLVWLNLGTLLFVALLPFSTSFSGDLPETPIGAIVFEANLLAIGMGMFFQWKYATGNHRLVEPDIPARFIRHVTAGTLFVPVLSFLGILIAMTGSLYSQTVYLLVPVMSFIFLYHERKKQIPPA
jgi:uncharacterized membrane protein